MLQNCTVKNTCLIYDEVQNLCPYADIFCIRQVKLPVMYQHSLLTPFQLNLSPLLLSNAPDCDEGAWKKLTEISDNILNFVKDGKNLFIYSSNCGNGKTTWAIQLLKSYLEKIWVTADVSDTPGLFVNVASLFVELKNNIKLQSEEMDILKQNLLTADLVVWDEIGVKSLTEYEHDQFYNFLNQRITQGKANIFTTNIDATQLQSRLGDRIHSRIVYGSDVVIFRNTDQRSPYPREVGD